MFELDREKQTITIEDLLYHKQDFRTNSDLDFINKSEYHRELYDFLKEWFSDNETIEVKTSGSTGIPKKMQVEKSRMMQSALLTCSFLDLKKGDSVLLCLPMQYIAGMMIVVRSLVCGLNVYPIAPSGNPLKGMQKKFDFAAMVPLQVFNSLSIDKEKDKLKEIKNLIIGGGAIDKEMENQVRDFPNKVYSTYGMTETLSHIALRKLNGVDASEYYSLFNDIDISLSDLGTLVIEAPRVSSDILYTNDIVDIKEDGSFKVIGRIDNVINTGGIKVQIEEVETMLKPYLNVPFAISSILDPKFGEIIVLVVEQDIDSDVFNGLELNHLIPKKIIKVDKIPYTQTTKIDRSTLKNIIKNIF